MRKHKYLNKIYKLIDRMDLWKDKMGHDDQFLINRDDVNELLRLCTANDDYEVPKYRLRNCNKYWNAYYLTSSYK